MEEIVREVVKTITEFATNTNPFIGIIIGIGLIILESILPIFIYCN